MLANLRITNLCKTTVEKEVANLRRRGMAVDKDVMAARTDEIGIAALVDREAIINRRITTTLKATLTPHKATTR